MPLQATSGAASYDAFGGGVAAVPNYIEDVFSTYLYTGNGSTQTITNGIDLATEGGLVWLKGRDVVSNNTLADTTRGTGSYIYSNSTSAADTGVTSFITAFNTTGFSLGSGSGVNQSSKTWTSWTFRKQPKFFDVVTYTGDGTSSRGITHGLTSVPGMVMIKRTDSTGGWATLNRFDNTEYRIGSPGYSTPCGLNYTAALLAGNITTYASSTVFNVGSSLWGATETFNTNGATYVAYLFAHNAGGFGLTGTDNVISCGSATPNGSGVVDVTLGYEPQWLLVKTVAEGTWFLVDNMRGFSVTNSAFLRAQASDAEISGPYFAPNATGFTLNSLFGSGANPVIYIAIRRGPMKVPTSGTSVFSPVARAGTSATATVTTGFPVDMTIIQDRTQNSFAAPFDRLRGATNRLFTPFTAAEASEPTTLTSFAVQDGFTLGTDLSAGFVNTSGDNYINWSFRRAPSFFDEVCYLGNGTGTNNQTHNLGVRPELVITKNRAGVTGENWSAVYVTGSIRGTLSTINNFVAESSTDVNISSTTSTIVSYAGNPRVNSSGGTYVSYLFATCAGVSKVGSYTGNGSSQTINCGFTGGARFVLIKKTSGTGDWMISDSARGIVSGNDPYLELNNTNAEVTGEDWLDTDSTGFIVNEVSDSNANTNGATYLFLAIA